jgi:hypothetical protein
MMTISHIANNTSDYCPDAAYCVILRRKPITNTTPSAFILRRISTSTFAGELAP